LSFRIDASTDGGMLKWANDEWRQPNAKMSKQVVTGVPCLTLTALMDIAPQEEIRYDYGASRAPWRQKVSESYRVFVLCVAVC
jgi:SET domain-containing protein